MQSLLSLSAVALFCLLGLSPSALADNADDGPDFVSGDASQVPPRPKSPGESAPGGMNLKVPKLTPEEQHSTNMPSHMRCEGCQAVIYQMQKKLAERESKQLTKERGKPLRESQYLDVFEKLCTWDWEGYGVKDVDGTHHISGPGLPAESHMSMMYGGGQWPTRLNKQCGEIVEEVGEDDLYRAYHGAKAKPSGLSPELFCKTILTDCKSKPVKRKAAKSSKTASDKGKVKDNSAKDEL